MENFAKNSLNLKVSINEAELFGKLQSFNEKLETLKTAREICLRNHENEAAEYLDQQWVHTMREKWVMVNTYSQELGFHRGKKILTC